jgi:hypothetical protein
VPTVNRQPGKATITWSTTEHRTKKQTIHQQDEIVFTIGADARTRFEVNRAGETLLSVD